MVDLRTGWDRDRPMKKSDIKKNVEMLYKVLEKHDYQVGPMVMMTAELLAYYDGVLEQLGTAFSQFFAGRDIIIEKYNTVKGGSNGKEPSPKNTT